MTNIEQVRLSAAIELTVYSDNYHRPQSQEEGFAAIQIIRIEGGVSEKMLGLPLMKLGGRYSIRYPKPVEYSHGLAKEITGTLSTDHGFLYLKEAHIVYDGSDARQSVDSVGVSLTEDMEIRIID